MEKMKINATIKRFVTAIVLIIFSHISTKAQQLLWSDEFEDAQLDESIWTYAIGDGCDMGICGWGNQELQTYTDNNTKLENGRLVITARRENVNNKQFTSARLLTKDKVSVKYGRIEASIKLPDMNNGLWPAFWMLGDGNRWPFNGEIDIMEAGFNATSTNANAVAKANVFWRAEDAGVTGDLQYGNEDDFQYNAVEESGKQLNDDFYVYRVDWTPESLTAFVLETDAQGNPIESSAYEVLSIDKNETFESEFFSDDNFYILLNLAVGGWLPFSGEENQPSNVSALPNQGSEADMLVEYVRVYDIAGTGQVSLGNVEEELLSANGFGIFSDNLTTANQLEFGVDAEIFLWEAEAAPSIQLDSVQSPFGSEAFQVSFPANQYAGVTFNSSDMLNIDNYKNGSLRFKMKTTSQEPFSISIESNTGASAVDFPAGEEKFGLLRDGQWHDVTIPLSLLVTNFKAVQAPFTLGNMEYNNPTSTSTFLIDEIHYSTEPADDFETYVPASGNYGLYTQSSVADEMELGTEGDLYVWEETLVEGSTQSYNGQTAISYVGNNKGWFGLGFTADQLHDMSAFSTGNLHIAMKSSSDATLNVSINKGLAEGTVVLEAGTNQYGFVRDGNWHELTIPISDFEGLNSSGVMTLLSINGTANIADLALADIYFEYTGEEPKLSTIEINPANATISEGETQQFVASAFDQDGEPFSTDFNWDATGGTINAEGLYTGTEVGEFVVSASAESVSAEIAITVDEVPTGFPLPGLIEAENYEEDRYFDTTSGNTGGAYRTDDVDIEATSDASGEYNIGWIEAGEWLEYDIEASADSELYDISIRLASPSAAGQLHIEIDGQDVSGPLFAPNTGGWQSYENVTIEDVTISKGNHVMRIVFDAPGFNLNFIEATEAEGDSSVLTTITISPEATTIDKDETQQFSAEGFDQNGNPMQTSFNWLSNGGTISESGLFTASTEGEYTITASSNSVSATAQISVIDTFTGFTIPGRVEAENFKANSYYDTSAGNTGGAFRPNEDVDIEITGDQDGAYNVGWTAAGEWLEFDIDAQASNFDINLRVASATGGGSMRIEIDGNDATGPVEVPNTGGWQSYQTITVEDVTFAEGGHVLRVYFLAEGINFNYLSFDENPISTTGCTQSGPNDDYLVEISENAAKPSLTFKPGYEGVGESYTLLYYGTDPESPLPGYNVNPNEAFEIDVNEGETIYFYYTYSVPEGGERNSVNQKHSFKLGDCSTSARITEVLATDDNRLENKLSVYPNPVSETLVMRLQNDKQKTIRIVDNSGRTVITQTINERLLSLDVRSLEPGLYLIRVEGDSKSLSTRFIKE